MSEEKEEVMKQETIFFALFKTSRNAKHDRKSHYNYRMSLEAFCLWVEDLRKEIESKYDCLATLESFKIIRNLN